MGVLDMHVCIHSCGLFMATDDGSIYLRRREVSNLGQIYRIQKSVNRTMLATADPTIRRSLTGIGDTFRHEVVVVRVRDCSRVLCPLSATLSLPAPFLSLTPASSLPVRWFGCKARRKWWLLERWDATRRVWEGHMLQENECRGRE